MLCAYIYTYIYICHIIYVIVCMLYYIHYIMLYYICTLHICMYLKTNTQCTGIVPQNTYVGLATSKDLLHYLSLPVAPPRFMHYFVVTHKSSISNAHGHFFNVMEHNYDVHTCVQMYVYVRMHIQMATWYTRTHTHTYL